MGTTCVAYRVWSSNRFRLLLTQRGEAGADGKEDVSDDRPDRDLRALVRGPFPGPDRRQFGPGPQDGPQVSGPGYGGRFGPWWPPVMTEAQWRARAASWFPAVVDKGLRQVTWPAIGAHRDYIRAQLAAGVMVSTIHQRLVDEHALVASVASVRRWVGGNMPEEARRAQVRVLRPGPVEPGSEAQIDYGRLGVWTDPATGRRHTVQAFVMVLSCSRYMFVRPVLRM